MPISGDTAFRPISPEAFAVLGAPGLAYVRPIEMPEGHFFGIFAADGTQVGVAPARDLAFALARQHDLDPVSVH